MKFNYSQNITCFLLYLVFFHLLFIQFPLNDSLFNNTDTWFNIAIYNDFGNKIKAIMTSQNFGAPFFPFKNYLSLGDAFIGGALVFNFYKLFGLDDIWSYYFSMSLFFTLNGFALYLLIMKIIKNYFISFISGLLFCINNFSFAIFDNQNAIVFFPLFFSIYYILEFFEKSKIHFVFLSAILCAIQVYFGVYNFIFNIIIIILLYYFNLKIFKSIKKIYLIIAGAILLVTILPYLMLIQPVFSLESIVGFDSQVEGIKIHSVEFIDFIRVIDGNILFNKLNDILNPWQYNAKSIYIGFSIYLVSFIGFLNTPLNIKRFLLTILLIGFILALGPSFNIGDKTIRLPLYYFYKIFPPTLFFRNTSRAFFLCILSLVFFYSFGLNYIIKKNKYGKIIGVLLLLLFVLENVPFNFQKFNSAKYINPPNDLKKFLANKPLANMAFLPSSIEFQGDKLQHELNNFNREFIYWLWQTKLRHNIINGYSGYVNPQRLENNLWLNNIEKKLYLKKLIENNNLDYIVLFKKLILNYDRNPYLFLINSNLISKSYETNEVLILRINGN